MDWTRRDLDHALRVLMVDPLNLSTVRGELRGVEQSGRLSLDYYSDRRMNAEVSTSVGVGEGDGWDGSSALRIVHDTYVDDEVVHSEALGTFYVTSAPWEEQHGIRSTKYTLVSTIYGAETNTCAGTYTIAKGATGLDVISKVMRSISRPWRKVGNARNHKFNASVVFPLSSTYLSILFEVCNRCNNRLSVDEMGFVTVEPYTEPSAKSPSIYENLSDTRTGAIDPVTGSEDTLSSPERVVVTSTKDNKTIVGTAVAPAGSPSRHSVRGYCVDDTRQVTDLNPFTKARAEQLAKQYLNTALQVTRERTLGLAYRPLREGDVIRLTDSEGTRRWLIKSAELDLSGWTWKLTLSGGWQ